MSEPLSNPDQQQQQQQSNTHPPHTNIMSSGSSSSGDSGVPSSLPGHSSAAALEGFVLLAKSSSGDQLVMVLKQIIKHPQIFVFGEILDIPAVQQLEHTPHKPYLDLLKLFAYGVWSDYQSSRASLPPLSESETVKLKQLSIVTMAGQQRRLPYSLLLSSLSLSTVRSLEDLVISAVYDGLLDGVLNQKESCLEVRSTIGRDIGPKDVSEMIGQLQQWLESSQTLMSTLSSQLAAAESEEVRRRRAEEDRAQQRTKVLEEIRNNKNLAAEAGVAGVMSAEGMTMGVERERKSKKSAKGGLSGMFSRGR